MDQLQEKGAAHFFLAAASVNVDWRGGSTDIERNQLETIANEVNRKYGTSLDAFDVRLTWAKFRALWKTWVKVKYYVRRGKVDSSTGTVDTDDFEWDQLVRIVPGAEVFRRKPMIEANFVCTIFNQTPEWLAPEEQTYQLRKPSSSRSSKKRRPSPKEVEEEEIKACMHLVDKIPELNSSERYHTFCSSLFKDPVIRETFNLLPNKFLRRKYVLTKFDELHVAH